MSVNIFAQKSKSQPPTLSAMVTVNQYQDGKLFDDILYIFEFRFIPKELVGDEICYIHSTTISNINCSKEPFGVKGFWIKPEYSSRDTHGDKFVCKMKKIDGDRWELSINEPVGVDDGFIIHRLTFKNHGNLSDLINYSGNLNKYSSITNKTEIATYKPMLGNKYETWKPLKLGCPILAAPVIADTR